MKILLWVLYQATKTISNLYFSKFETLSLLNDILVNVGGRANDEN